jgi:AmmeMemoRadiSam system protein B
MLKFSAFLPHPPILIPTIGSESDLRKVSKTIDALNFISQEFSKENPETVIIVSPHAPLFENAFSINFSSILFGHFFAFGDFQTELVFRNDKGLVKKIVKEARNQKIEVKLIESKELDHGTLVPLFYLTKMQPQIKIVSLGFSLLSREKHFQFGKLIQKIIQKEKKNVAFIASGDLSHCLKEDAPGGYSEKGEIFDRKIIELLKKKDVKGILNLDEGLVEEAGECGYRSLLILLGVLDGINWKPEILSYEGPFGVGYLVAEFSLSNNS